MYLLLLNYSLLSGWVSTVQKRCANKAAATNGHTRLQLTPRHHCHMASALWDPGLRADVESLTHLCAAIGESGNICIFFAYICTEKCSRLCYSVQLYAAKNVYQLNVCLMYTLDVHHRHKSSLSSILSRSITIFLAYRYSCPLLTIHYC